MCPVYVYRVLERCAPLFAAVKSCFVLFFYLFLFSIFKELLLRIAILRTWFGLALMPFYPLAAAVVAVAVLLLLVRVVVVLLLLQLLLQNRLFSCAYNSGSIDIDITVLWLLLRSIIIRSTSRI